MLTRGFITLNSSQKKNNKKKITLRFVVISIKERLCDCEYLEESSAAIEELGGFRALLFGPGGLDSSIERYQDQDQDQAEPSITPVGWIERCAALRCGRATPKQGANTIPYP